MPKDFCSVVRARNFFVEARSLESGRAFVSLFDLGKKARVVSPHGASLASGIEVDPEVLPSS